MLTDKQSIILCGLLVLGFMLAGVFNILDNIAIIGLIVCCFIVIIANIVIVLKREIENPPNEDESDSDE